MSKVMVTVVGPFEADPTVADSRTFTIGDPDPDVLARRVGEWAHDVTARLLAPEDDAPVEPPEALWKDIEAMPEGLWHPPGVPTDHPYGHCKECYRSVLPMTMIEECAGGRTRMALCTVCGRGLTPPEPVK